MNEKGKRRWTLNHVYNAAAFCLLILLMHTPTARGQEVNMPDTNNLIKNADFAAITDGIPADWNLTGASATLQQHITDRSRIRLTGSASARTRLWQTVQGDPTKTYILRLAVCSDSRVVVRLGALTMSYHDQGNWQQLVGIAKPAADGSLRINLSLGSLDGNATAAMIGDVSLVEYHHTTTAPPRRAQSPITSLAQGATIVYPATDPVYRALAQRVADAIAKTGGPRLSIITDIDATTPGPPVLRKPYADQHLIILGRLDNNRALWPAYNRFLAATDGYYPGGDGYVVRTAVNVRHNNRNHIILGGSSQRGVERAIETFINKLTGPTLPWLLDVELGGECLEVCRQRDQLWTDDPDSTQLVAWQPGYGTVRRWYENAMGYYWTGWDSYKNRTKTYLSRVLDDSAYTHQYLIEFFLHAWDMVDDSDLFTDADRASVDNLIVKNFEDFLLGHDLTWMTIFTPPYDSIRLLNRHQVAPWYADLRMANFLQDTLTLDGALRDLATFRASEKKAVFRHLIDTRPTPSPPGTINGSQCHEEIIATMYRYALEQEWYNFFDEGRAHRALALDFTDHRTGAIVRPADRQDHPLLLGILAHYFRDARYQTLREQLRYIEHSMGPFQGRYVCGIHRYTPSELPKTKTLDAWTGLLTPPFTDHERYNLYQYAHKPYAKTSVTPDEAFNFAAFRGGFDATDDYLAVSGVAAHCPPGAILRFSAHDVTWLGGPGESYFDAAGLHVQRTDTWSNDTSPYASVAKQLYAEQSAVGFVLQPHCGMRWQREIVWLRPHRFVVRDRITAIEDGTYRAVVSWHPTGSPQWREDHWHCATDKAYLRITPLGHDITVTTDTAARFGAQVTLKAGESREWITVLESHNQTAPAAARLDAQGNVALVGENQSTAVIWQDNAAPQVNEISNAPANTTTFAAASSAAYASTPWQSQWSYTGLHRPAQVHFARRMDDNTVDFGRIVPLAEIRTASRRGGAWVALTFPDTIEASNDGQTWQTIDAPRHWRPGTRTGNYGESHPIDEDIEAITLDGLPARYIRGEGAMHWMYFAADQHEARRAMQLTIADTDGDGSADLLVKPRVWPKYLRRSREEDDMVALLDGQGNERFTHEASRNFQDIALLDHFGDGRKQVTVIERDGMTKAFDAAGKIVRQIDLYELHKKYNEQFGKPNTRHPAGGMVMPYGIGAWRGNAGETSPLVIARYGALSFIDGKDNLTGPLMISGYVYPAVLPQGIDLDGDGSEEQIVLGRGVLMRVRGEATPYVSEPDGHLFYPQVYRYDRLLEPAWTDALDGPELYVFQPLPFGGSSRYVAIVRSNYIGVYDGKDHKWAYAWSPMTQIQGAAILQAKANELAIAAVTSDGLIWRLQWQDTFDKPSSVSADVFAAQVNSLTSPAKPNGDLLIAGNDGLFLQRAGQAIARIAEGSFTDSAFIEGDIAAVHRDGTVERFSETKGKP